MQSIRPLNSFEYLLQGFNLMLKPGIRLYAFAPIIINIIIFIGFGIVAAHYYNDFIAWFNTHIPTWLHWLSGLLWALFIIALMLISVYSFTFIANLIAAPFNGLLAEQVELYLTGKTDLPSTSLIILVKDIPRSIGRQLRYLGYFLPRALLILMLFLIPAGQIIATPLWFLFNAWTFALQYLDYPMDNHRVGFSEMRRQLQQHRLTSLGFGTTIVLLTMIPIVNLFIMPAAVAGATRLWVSHFKPSTKAANY